jgi:hypothetical protein
MNKVRDSRFGFSPWLPIATVLGTTVILGVVQVAQSDHLKHAPPVLQALDGLTTWLAKSRWVLSAQAFGVALFGLGATAWLVVVTQVRPLSDQSKKLLALSPLALALAAAVVCVPTLAAESPLIACRGEAFKVAQWQPLFHRWLLGALYACSWWATLAFGALLLPLPSDDQARTQALKTRLRLANLLLYVGSGALMVGVVYTLSANRWFAPFASDTAAGEAIRAAAAAAALGEGLRSSFLLAAAYLPVRWCLTEAARREAEQAEPDVEKQVEWLSSRGLLAPVATEVPRVIALATPFMAGVLTDLLHAVR